MSEQLNAKCKRAVYVIHNAHDTSNVQEGVIGCNAAGGVEETIGVEDDGQMVSMCDTWQQADM